MKKLVISAASLIFGLFLVTSQTGSANSASYQYLAGDSGNAWAVMALRAAGQQVSADNLSVDNLATATDLERTILGVVAGNGDPFSFKTRNLVSELEGKRVNSQMGDDKLVNDDIFAVLAYVAAGVPTKDSRIQDSKNFILKNQNTDGGFAYASRFPSDTNITAMTIIALLRSGVAASHESIQNALAYLQEQQNTDGGFGIQTGEPSDAASTAWVISALQTAGVDANDWRQQQDPYEFLESLLTSNGSYKWRASDSSGQSTMTAYAVIAQNNASYPVAALPERVLPSSPIEPLVQPDQPAPTQPTASAVKPTIRYRIEGKSNQICQGEAPASTVLEALEAASAKCNVTFDVLPTVNGPYVNRIGKDQAQDGEAWHYLLNWKPMGTSINQPILIGNDYVTWYYGQYGMPSLKLLPIERQPITHGEQLTFTVDTLHTGWSGIDSTIYINEQEYRAQPMTRVNLMPGTYAVYASKPGYIRGHVNLLTVR